MAWNDITPEILQKYGLQVGVPPADSEDEMPEHNERLALMQVKLDELERDFPNVFDHIRMGSQGAFECCMDYLGPKGHNFAAHMMLCVGTWMWLEFASLREANEQQAVPAVVAEAEATLKQA